MLNNPYESPKTQAASLDQPGKASARRYGKLSLLCAAVPPVFLLGSFAAYTAGLPSPTAWFRTLFIFSLAIASILAAFLGAVGLSKAFHVSAAVGLVLGVLESLATGFFVALAFHLGDL